MENREELKQAFVESRVARNFVVPVLKERIVDIDRTWYIVPEKTREELATEKRVILQIAKWLGILTEVEPDAPSASFGHPSLAPNGVVGT